MEDLSIHPELDVYKGNITMLTFPDLSALRSWSRFHELEKLGEEVHYGGRIRHARGLDHDRIWATAAVSRR